MQHYQSYKAGHTVTLILLTGECVEVYVSYLDLLPALSVPFQDSLCSPQLIMEDEGLSRLAQTVQTLSDLADQRAPKT